MLFVEFEHFRKLLGQGLVLVAQSGHLLSGLF